MSSGRNNKGQGRGASGRGTLAFTLLELLVVIAIIGVLAAVALPKIGAFGKSNATIAATRQLLDDISFARTRAMSSRSDVYIVFMPPVNRLTNSFLTGLSTEVERNQATNLLSGQYTRYALFSDRSVGEQPGVKNPRYLTPWKTLPSGTFIAGNKFNYNNSWPYLPDGVAPFATEGFPFPLATSKPIVLPCIGFDYQGRLINQRDEVIPLARGSIFYDRDANGMLVAPFTADVLENPPFNSVKGHVYPDGTTNLMWMHIAVDWLTGRPRVERQEVQ